MAKTASKKPVKKAEEELPSGFTPMSASQGAAWWQISEGAVVRGELLGRFSMRGKRSERYYYQVRLAEATEGIRTKEDGVTEVDVGEVINVDERHALQSLADLCKGDDRYEIFIKAIEKIELESGNSVWRFNVGNRVIGKKAKAATADDDGVPF